MDEPLTTSEVADYSGLTMRQLDSWSREQGVLGRGWPASAGSGKHRQWTAEQARCLLVLRRLSDTRATARVFANAAKVLVKSPPTVGDRRWLIVSEARAEIVHLRDLPATVDDGAWCVPLRIDEET